MQYRACLPLIATVSADASTGVTYTANSGKAIGKLMTVSISQDREDIKVYADNGIAENVKIFKSATVTLGATFVPETAESVMFGNTYSATDGITDKDNDDGDYTGFGFVVGERENGSDVYRLYWLYKVKWTLPDADFETKGESVSFKNPSITGTAYAGGDGKWRLRKTFSSEEAAIEALKTLAKYPSSETNSESDGE